MTFLQWVTDNRTKILGSITAVLSAVVVMVSSGTFDGLLTDIAVKWMAIICSLTLTALGAGTAAVGFSNTTRERVAASAATVAVARAETAEAMETAIMATPPAQTTIRRDT